MGCEGALLPWPLRTSLPKIYAFGSSAQAHQVNERNAVLLQRGHMAWQVAPRQDPAMYARVQRLHATYADILCVSLAC